MRHTVLLGIALAVLGSVAAAQPPPLLPESDVAALANELSGETAKRNLEGLARFHRQRGSQGFHAAAELVAASARAYGLSNVEILQFPADGKIFYGTQLSRPAWDAEEGELSEVTEVAEGKSLGNRSPADRSPANRSSPNQSPADRYVENRIASYSAEPIVLAEDSESGEATANLVDVGDGSKDSDYAGKDVGGKFVLVATVASEAQDIAIGKYHAAGIISYAQNQSTAWTGDNDNLIRWGHLEPFSPNKTYAFMVSLRTARAMQDRLRRGESIRLHARVKAGQHPAFYEVVTATIEGSDPKLKESEIAFSCHLDHQRPGANDNASGCVTILESARALANLIENGKLPRPARTLRFIWGPEVEGTMAFLSAHRDVRRSLRADVHMDMVGGDPYKNKSILHVTETPWSLPSFVTDVGELFAETIRNGAAEYAEGGSHPEAAVLEDRNGAPGTRNEFLSDRTPYSDGSDHDDYDSSTIAVPSLYLRDWPDIYIHTDHDTLEQIDATKLRRVALLGAAAGYTYAAVNADGASSLLPFFAAPPPRRLAEGFERAQGL